MSEIPEGSPLVDPGATTLDADPGWPFRDNAVVRRWVDAGFDFDAATRWYEVWGAGHEPAELEPWHSAGFSARVSLEWSRAGVELDEALEWRSLGCSVEEAALFGSLDALHRWRELGFSLKRARQWRRIPAVGRPGPAAEWRAIGCTPAEAKRWLEVPGVNGPAEVEFWKSFDCTPRTARGWLGLNGITTQASLERWLASTMPLAEAREWDEALDGALDAAESWIAAGCRPKDAARWHALRSITQPSDVTAWRSVGIGPRDLVRWERALDAVTPLNPELVLGWMFAGCGPKQAARCTRAGLMPVDLMRLREQGVKISDAPSVADYVRPTPLRGTNEPLHRAEEIQASAGCLSGDHDSCDRPKLCRCACHCWHDERRFDYRLQSQEAGWHPPHFLYGTGHARHCRSTDPKHHAMCRSGSHCGCPCHCWHQGLGITVPMPQKRSKHRDA